MPQTQKEKRERAEERAAARAARTNEEQMELIAKRPGDSLREMAAINASDRAPAKKGKKA
jgi:hypothetical protein